MAALQWGRDVSAAEITADYTLGAGAKMLQWGRDVSAAEMLRRLPMGVPASQASMGPRRFRRGNALVISAALIPALVLQWGRDVSAW